MLAPGIRVSSSALGSQPFISVVTHVPKMFYGCFFLKYAHFKNNLKEEGDMEQVWWRVWVGADCHLPPYSAAF